MGIWREILGTAESVRARQRFNFFGADRSIEPICIFIPSLPIDRESFKVLTFVPKCPQMSPNNREALAWKVATLKGSTGFKAYETYMR